MVSELRANPQGTRSLGEILKERNLITDEQLEEALAVAASQGKKLGEVLVAKGLISPLSLATTLSYQLNVPLVDLKKVQASPEAIRMVPEEFARRHKILPVSIDSGVMQVATSDPQDVIVLEDLRARVRMRIKPLLAMADEIEDAINRQYRATGEIQRQISQISSPNATVSQDRVSPELITQSPVVRSVDLMISQAVKDRASDIHLEPQRDEVRVRYRIDGILHDAMTLPTGVHAAIVSRLKVMAGMNIAERRRPQDGQFSIKVEQSEVDVRAATIETDNGEMVVLRILDKSLSLLKMEEIGLEPGPLATMEKILKAPFGSMLISGPTGSGKTTTLYAGVNYLDKSEHNIITIEDPIEYHFDGINQIQVNRQADITFATGLRAIMRLDPDIILVGEIRDHETAEIAVQAALTGHLLLSSIHANDAIGSLYRMMDLGVDPLLLASALIGTVSQRLVRRNCPHCKAPYQPSLEDLMVFRDIAGEEHDEFFKGMGCNFCANTGYLGRMAVFEIATFSEEFRTRLVKGMDASQARAQAIQDGMVPMQRDGMIKAKKGLTTISEIMRNVFVLN